MRRCGFRIVVDYAYGSASAVFPQILGTLGCEVIALNGCMDESRITKSAEEFRRSLHQLSEIVKGLRADLGVMLDAGGKRFSLWMTPATC
ncbi:MAG: hypothetical protein M5R38_12195 [Candidatus Methylomirabilis sp.]|nr:hypothetical protein [Candidatus Methylomirabilis sp.]